MGPVAQMSKTNVPLNLKWLRLKFRMLQKKPHAFAEETRRVCVTLFSPVCLQAEFAQTTSAWFMPS